MPNGVGRERKMDAVNRYDGETRAEFAERVARRRRDHLADGWTVESEVGIPAAVETPDDPRRVEFVLVPATSA